LKKPLQSLCCSSIVSTNSEAKAHIPGAIVELMQLIADLTASRSVLRGLPTRLELCEDDLQQFLNEEASRELLRSARFVGLKQGTGGLGLKELSKLRLLWGQEARHLDFEGRWGYPTPAALGEWPPVAVVRLSWHHAEGEVPPIADYGSQGHLHIDVHATWSVDDRERILDIISRLTAHKGPVTLKITPQTHRSSESLSASWELLEARARDGEVGIRAPYLGLKGGGRRSIPGLCGSAILEQALRSLFARHPSLCPFPFLMMGLTSREESRACPNPLGPVIHASPSASAWNSEELTNLRRAFLGRSELPASCKSCLILPRVRDSLAETLAGDDARYLEV
jgi:hypothetical protein